MDRQLFRKVNLGAVAPLKDFASFNFADGHTSLEGQHVSVEIQMLLASVGLQVAWIDVIVTPGNHTWECDYHIDGPPFEGLVWPSRAKLNWISAGKDSVMMWYDTIDPTYRGYPVLNILGKPIVYIKRDKCFQLLKQQTNGYILVDAGVPHSIANVLDEKRISISMMVSKLGESDWLPFDTVSLLLESLAL